MAELKRVLFDEYDGFADKRIKNLEKGSIFAADDRSDADLAARGGFLSHFCTIFVDVKSDDEVKVMLTGNVPASRGIGAWSKKVGAAVSEPQLSFKIKRGDEGLLKELASAMESIVASGAPRYSVPSYKYTCPRTAKSLRRLARVLGGVWSE